MAIVGDLTEFTNLNSIPDDIQTEIKSIPWELNDEAKFPIETFSLYSIDSDIVTIHELKNEVFEGIEKSEISRVSTHFHSHEQLFILFFEFALEKYKNEFEFVHFGIVPTTDFFNTITTKPIIKVRHKFFRLSNSSLKIIQEKLIEFKNNYPDNSLF